MADFDLRLQAKQYVAVLRDPRTGVRFRVLTTGFSDWYLFCPLDRDGCDGGNHFPVRAADLRPEYRRALAHGWGNAREGADYTNGHHYQQGGTMTTPLYTPVNPQAFQEEADRVAQERQSTFPKWKPKQGPVGRPARNVIRIAPPHVSMGGKPILTYKVHYSLGPNHDTSAPCLDFYNEACPACDWSKRLDAMARAEANPDRAGELKKLAWDTRSQSTHCMTVLDMARPEAGWQPYWFSSYAYENLKNAWYDDSTPPQWRDITDPQAGRDVILDIATKLGPQGQEWPDYVLVRAKEAPSPLIDADLLQQIPDLTQYAIKPTREEVMGALEGRKIPRGWGAKAIAAVPVPARTALPPAPAAAAVTPPPAREAEPRGRGRGRGAQPAAAPAPTPATVTAPPPASSAPARRAAPSAVPAAPYAAARAAIIGVWRAVYSKGQKRTVPPDDPHGGRGYDEMEPLAITPDAVALAPAKPPCFNPPDADPTDETACQVCPLLLDCYTRKHGLAA